MERDVQLFQQSRFRLDLNSLLQLPRRQNIPLGQMRHCKNQSFSLHKHADAQKIAKRIGGDSHDLDAAIAPDGHQAGCPKGLDRQSKWLPADPKPFRQRLLTQDGPLR